MSGRWRRFVFRLIPVWALCVALGIGAAFISPAGGNPWAAYWAVAHGAFGDVFGFGATLTKMAPILLAGLGVALAARVGLFNIGAEGQIYLGGLGAAWVGLYVPGLPAVTPHPAGARGQWRRGRAVGAAAGLPARRPGRERGHHHSAHELHRDPRGGLRGERPHDGAWGAVPLLAGPARVGAPAAHPARGRRPRRDPSGLAASPSTCCSTGPPRLPDPRGRLQSSWPRPTAASRSGGPCSAPCSSPGPSRGSRGPARSWA